MTSPLDPFIPHPDVRERFQTTVRAPPDLVMEVARNFDMQSLPLVRVIFRLRSILLRATATGPRAPQGLIKEVRGLGWNLLVDQPTRLIVCGAACQPWLANARFTPIAAEGFADFAEPDQVAIVWSLEAEPLGPALTRFAHETRVVATDASARRKFLGYWRWARFGIITIRLLLLPAIRRTAERRWAQASVPQGG
jgi:hypothetical protein